MAMLPPSAVAVGTELAAPMACGGMAWVLTCAASQLAQLSLLKVHTGHRFMPSLMGIATISAASVLSLQAGEQGLRRYAGNGAQWPKISALTAALLGGACFAALGGRSLTCFSPSGLAHLGALANTARGSLPATLAYASRAEREAIQQLGRRFGCHSCGARPLGPLRKSGAVLFHADHQPPLAEVKRANAALWRRMLNSPQAQRFYPQCVKCSGKQAKLLGERTALISQLGSKRRALRAATVPPAVLHSAVRVHHAAGGMLCALATAWPEAVAAADEMVRSAKQRVQEAAAMHVERQGAVRAAGHSTSSER